MTTHASRSAILLLAAGLWALAVMPWCARPASAQETRQAPDADSNADLVPVPMPSLDGAEAGLRRHIEDARAGLDRRHRDDAGGHELAAAYGELGSLYLLSGLRAAAEAALRNAHHLDPSEPRWPYFLALVRLDVGDSDGALDALRATLALRPDSVTVYLRLAETLRRAADLDQARALFEDALAKSPVAGEAAFARYGLGRIAIDQGRFEAAVEHLQAVRAAVPEATVVSRVLGLAYREVGRMEEARRQLRAGGDEPVPLPDVWTAELRAIDTGAYLAKAVEARLRGDLGGAERLYRQAAAADPESVEGLRGLAEVLFVAGDRAGSVETMRRAVAVQPERGDLHAKLGEFLALWGRPADAIAPYRRALELTPRAPEAHLGLGRALAMTGRHEEALGHYDQSLALVPDSLEARALKARALSRLGRYGAAAAELAEALAVEPGNVRVRLAHVDALARAGDTAAVRDSLEAGVASSGDPRLMATLIQVLIGDPDPHRRDPERAVAVGVELLRDEPSVAHAVVVARALFAAGRAREAVELHERALAEARSGDAPEAELAALEQALELYRGRMKTGNQP